MNESGDYLTVVPGVPSRASVVPGMAHFAGTGPAGERCRNCEFKGYYRKTEEVWSREANAWTYRSYLYGGCAMFKKLTGRHGPVFKGSNRSCKYFKLSKAATKETNMDISDQLSGGFIKADQFGAGELQTGVIANVAQGKFDKPDMELQDGRVLTLNATNMRTLANAWGPQTDEWIGKEIEMYVGETTFNGQKRDSVLVRTISPRTPWKDRITQRPAGSQPRKKELDDEIPF